MFGPELFEQRFGRPLAVLARAPGRVNLIGEHTDYNEGLVLPVALQASAWVGIALRDDGLINAHSQEFSESQSWPVDGWRRDGLPAWTAYVAGVAAKLREHGAHLKGFDLLLQSDVPVGAGLASSAAITVACAFGLSFAAGEALEATELVDLCRQVEDEFAGVPCGIMDQSASLLARAEHALLLDCRSRQVEHIPIRLGDHALLIVDSGVKHELAAGEYARRRQECEQAVAYFRRLTPSVRSLRDVSPETARAQALQMDPLLAARALHVVSENRRVQQAVEALRRNDFAALGRLMNESHASLRDQYEVSCPEVDELVGRLQSAPGVLGARMTGAGFGGAVVVLVTAAGVFAVESAASELTQRDGVARPVRRVTPGDGAKIVRG